ncbi:hypothetical protein BDN72DRAFT_850281 [Pluteus cervinus]|uniref:Uncharacterized protein n=1 Tax=Pluteus cervinus TaxID=181527 RepID=A0ACD3A4D2_9AGAR|nr:hypothetical protein BDN72DRAFT_850281 [Pluteus cervinus]
MAQMDKSRPLFYIDLYRNVVELIDPADRQTLTSLCLVCHNFYLESAPRLYHTFRYSQARTGKFSHMQHMRFLETVATSTRCAELVRSYSVFSSSGQPEVWNALPSLTNMVSLSMSYSEDAISPQHPIEQVLDKSAFPRLEFFAWNCVTKAEALCQFFQRHPGLRGIFIIWSPGDAEALPFPDTLPKLECLKGETPVITAFIVGRAVERVIWLAHQPSLASLPPETLGALRNVRHLVLKGPHWVMILSQIAQDLHRLEVLQLAKLKHWNMDMLISTIKMLPCIESMIVGDYRGVCGWSSDSHRFAVDIFKAGHSTLKYVYIKEEAGNRFYRRFFSKWALGDGDAQVLTVESVRILMEEHWIKEGVIESPSS